MQVLQLKVTIGNLVMAMIEENSVESLVVAKVNAFSLNHSPARQMYLGVDTLKELLENVESRNTVAFIKDRNFYHCI